MLVKELMEKLSAMNPEKELVVEGFDDEVETTEEETVETPEEPKSVWDRETEYNDPQSQGIHQIIKNAHDFKVGPTGKMKAPGADKDSPDEGVYYDENNNTLSDKKKLKLISKWKAIEAIQDGSWTHGGFGGHLDDEIELPKYPEYKQKYDDWCASSKYDPSIDIGLDMQLEKQFGSDEEEELDECGSACSAPIKEEAETELDECGGACAKPVTEEAEEPVVESEEEPLEESAEAIEARLNEQMKTDYQKDLEMISDFLF